MHALHTGRWEFCLGVLAHTQTHTHPLSRGSHWLGSGSQLTPGPWCRGESSTTPSTDSLSFPALQGWRDLGSNIPPFSKWCCSNKHHKVGTFSSYFLHPFTVHARCLSCKSNSIRYLFIKHSRRSLGSWINMHWSKWGCFFKMPL